MSLFLPTKKQWAGWSLPSKLTCIATYLAVVGLPLTVAFGVLPFLLKPTTDLPSGLSPAQYRALADGLNITTKALDRFFAARGKTNVPLDKVDSELQAFAKDYADLKASIQSAKVTTPQDVQTRTQALAALSAGDLPKAKELASKLPPPTRLRGISVHVGP